jgi:hypothetical protein
MRTSFNPDEELDFRLTAIDVSNLLTILDNQTVMPHRITRPLIEKLTMQAQRVSTEVTSLHGNSEHKTIVQE